LFEPKPSHETYEDYTYEPDVAVPEIAALLHDIGKQGVPNDILREKRVGRRENV